MYHGPTSFKIITNGSDHMRLRQSGYLEGKKNEKCEKIKGRCTHIYYSVILEKSRFQKSCEIHWLDLHQVERASKYTLIQSYMSRPFPTLPFWAINTVLQVYYVQDSIIGNNIFLLKKKKKKKSKLKTLNPQKVQIT